LEQEEEVNKMRVKRKSKGFTLVELLVVITIIGMLMSLLLPAVQNAREAGRRNTCMNNQKQWATALLNYEGARKSFPGLINDLGKPKKLSGNNVPIVYGSWVVSLLPYIERSDVYEMWTDGYHFDSNNLTNGGLSENGRITIQMSTCPSNQLRDAGDDSHLSYRANAGRQGYIYEGEDSTSCGIFDLNITDKTVEEKFSSYVGKSPGHTISLDQIRDGSSNTLMLSETSQEDDGLTGHPSVANLGWATGYKGPQDLSDPVSQEMLNYESWLGFRIPNSSNTEEWFEFENGPFSVNRDGRENGNARGASPSSFHHGVVIVAFADGRVQPLNENVDHQTYLHLMTPNGKKFGRWIGSSNGPNDAEMDDYFDEATVLDDKNYQL
jgi:prepilin-type N-terminal cleavage/methylation domain-containing protein